MKNKKSIILICSLALMVSCSKQPYYNVPNVVNGVATITDISTATSAGITTLDDNFTVNVTLPNAKAGDVMTVELLKQQIPKGGGTSTQLLPLDGTQQNITVGSDLTASVTYTKAQAQMHNVGDPIYVSWAGKTESASLVVTLTAATVVKGPYYNGNSVKVIRGAGTAYFDVNVAPASGPYTGNVIVQRKNGINDPWVSLGSFGASSQVPISGDDFAIGKDTMYYSFVASSGSNTDSVTEVVVDNDPYFFLKKSGTLTLGGSSGGLNLLVNGAVAANDANAIIAIDGDSLTLHGGSAWAAGKSISFVPSTQDMYEQNNPAAAIAAFMNGSPAATADPSSGEGVYIFKFINGPDPSDVFYGILKVTSLVPGTSVSYEYRIGNKYNQLSAIK